MKKMCALFLFILASYYVQGQKRMIAMYNHTQFYVHNVDTIVAFYKKIFDADTIPMPFPPSATARTKWVRMGNDIELHMTQNVPDTIPISNRFHLGFTVVSVDDIINRLMKENTEYRTGKHRKPITGTMPSGAKTTIIRDPESNRIHLIEAQ